MVGLICCLAASQAVPDCPSSQWNGRICYCSVGMVQLNGKCVCDYGYYNSNGSCFQCSSSNTYNGLSCSGSSFGCQTGYALDNTSNCRLNWNVDNCQAGSFWNGASCEVRTSRSTCKAGFVSNGVVCASQFANVCGQGNYYNGVSCVAFTNPPVCMTNYRWDSLTSSCVYGVKTNASCANSSYWDG